MTNKKNSVLILNKRYGQELNIFQIEQKQKQIEAGGIINERTVRDTDLPLYEFVQLREHLFGRTEKPQEEVPTGFRGYIEGKGFFDGTETA